MVFSFLSENNLGSKYTAAKLHTENLTEPFPDFERIARNRPKSNMDKRYPKTTDGTTAAVIRKIGRRVVQQVPTGKIESDEGGWLPVVANFIFTNKILPYSNKEYDFIQKCWQIIERGGTFGSTATYTPFVNHDGYFCPDLTLPYWGDVFFQPGKKSGYDCDYIFLRSWWQPEDIDAQIEREKKLQKSAKERGEKYESDWDIKALEEAKEKLSRKDDKARTPHENDRNDQTEAIELVTGLQMGVGATFYTFIPSSSEDDNDVTVLRRKKNKDPRGKYNVQFYYHDTDGANPLGRGIVELVGGLQNLIDSDMQMYQYNRALMLAPPIVKRGNVSKKKIVFAPNAIIDLGNDDRATVEPLKIDTSAVTNYPNLYGLQKSQLLNLVSSPDTSISSEVGNPGFGKTPTALNQQQANVSVDDNYIRKSFESWFENWAECAINLFFAERTGIEELQLDEKTANELRKLAQKGEFDESQLSEDNKILIDYDTATPALKFRVDASTSKMKEDATQGETLMGLLEALQTNPLLAQSVPQDKILAAWNRIVANSGVEDPEDLSIDLDEWREQQEMLMQQQAEQQMAAQAQPQPVDGQQMPVEGVPEAAPETDDVQMVTDALRAEGVPDSLIQEAHALLDQGESGEDVLEAIAQTMGWSQGAVNGR